jgi:ElaB/YqjD/DUF883 family membrane-anchored ribosome-binding protein
MDQREIAIKQDIKETRAAMDRKIEMIENRVHGTVEEAKSTVDAVVNKVKHVHETVLGAKSKVDDIIESASIAMDETVERAKYTTSLVREVNQSPWITLGSAVLLGYVLGNLSLEKSLVPSGHRKQINTYSRAGTLVRSQPSA